MALRSELSELLAGFEKRINKSDVINCFDIVIKAIVKKRPMSNNELLTHEGNESIEHGFYRSEQLSLL